MSDGGSTTTEPLRGQVARESKEATAQAHADNALRPLRSTRDPMGTNRPALGAAVHPASDSDAAALGGACREVALDAPPRVITIEVEHTATRERRACEYVECLANSRQRARVVAVRWPIGGLGLFCLASGWNLQALRAPWRLTSAARERARALAANEGLRLPALSEWPSQWRPPAELGPEPPSPPPIDPRQVRLPF